MTRYALLFVSVVIIKIQHAYIFINMEYQRRSQVVRQRAQRHNRLMKMIKNYSCTQEQQKKLQKIKMNTMMEINIRYMRSEHNRHYKFPFTEIDSEEEDQTNYDPYINKKELIVYNLHSQNAMFSKSPENKKISLSSSRKVLSLQMTRNQSQRDRLLRFNFKPQNFSPSSKNLTRKNSMAEKVKKQGSKLRLPQLKKQRSRENLKTESRQPEQEQQIREVIGKKLLTEASEGRSKMQGVQKYLRKMEINKQSEVKNSFKKRMFLAQRHN